MLLIFIPSHAFTQICIFENQPFHFYRQPTKLLEGNVFTGVCQSLCQGAGGRGWVGTSHTPWLRSHGSGCPIPWTYPPLRQWPQPHPWTYSPLPSASPLVTSGDHHWRHNPLLVTSGGHHWRHIRSLFISGPTLFPRGTSSGGNWNWNMYSFKAGGMRPTGMFSC